MNLTLRKVNVQCVVGGAWVDREENWIIRNADQKIRAKYGHGSTLVFDHYVFHHTSARSARLSSVDVEAADRLMNAQIGRKLSRRNAIYSAMREKVLTKHLEKIPWSATILDTHYDEHVRSVFEVLIRHDVRLAIASKILTVKRPFLIPMMDSAVQICFGVRGADDPLQVMNGFRRVMKDAGTASALDDLRALVRAEFQLDVSTLRILDQLIWFDWNLKRETAKRYVVNGFEEWSYNPSRHAEGVIRSGVTVDPTQRTEAA